VFLQHGVNCKLVIVVCFTSPDLSWKIVEIIDYDFVVSLCVYYGGIVHVLFNCITSDEYNVRIILSLQVLLVNIMKRA
jgi:hypothetical protein